MMWGGPYLEDDCNTVYIALIQYKIISLLV